MAESEFRVCASYKVGNSQVKDPTDLSDLSGVNLLLGLYVELSQIVNGLSTGSVLVSAHGNRWVVVRRIINSPALGHAKKFSNELVLTLPLPGNDDIDVYSVSQSMISKETSGILIYRIEPLGHSEKPVVGEFLRTHLEN